MENLLQDILWRRGIDIQDGEGVAARFVPAEAHAGDVDAVFAHEHADPADHARAVSILVNDERAIGTRFHEAAVDFHDARRAAEEGAGEDKAEA